MRIYIDTPTFDKITKDQSSKLEDRISTIGGNLGLFTGGGLLLFDAKLRFSRILLNIIGRSGLLLCPSNNWNNQR